MSKGFTINTARWLAAGAFAAAALWLPSEVEARLDPTRPIEFKPRAVAADNNDKLPQLTSILIGETRRVAVIDGQLAAEGDTVGTARVRKILPTHVVVGIGEPEERLVLRLDRAEIVKEPR